MEDKMNVVAFNGSPRKDGNTSILINTVFSQLEKEGIKTQKIDLANMDLRGCLACYQCFQKKYQTCSNKKDGLNDCIKKMLQADGIIIGSPVYFGSITPQAKALVDRAGYCARAGGFLLKRKVCAGIAVARRQGCVNAINQINNLLMLNQAIMPFSSYWNMGIGREKGDILKDSEGMETFKTLGEKMAWLLKSIK